MSKELTQEELATNAKTLEHIHTVGKYIHIMVAELLKRADNHDKSKLESPEVEIFTEFTPRLAKLTYGSDEYNECLKQMKPAIDSHYAANSSRHHPEHHKNGINDFNLIDLIEFFVDCKAASERQNNGNLLKSIEINGRRFDMSPQLVKILENTAAMIEQQN